MARRRGIKSLFSPTNPSKYTGSFPIIAKSSWEAEFMKYCDNHPGVLSWAYEPINIPYENPLSASKKNKQSIYKPDFLVTYLGASGKESTKLIEIKPMHETYEAHARNNVDALIRIKNEAKWGAAHQWAMRRGIDFIFMTEADMFNNHANRKGRPHPIKAKFKGKELLKKTTPKAPKRKKTTTSKKKPSIRSRISKTKGGLIRKSPKVGKVKKR